MNNQNIRQNCAFYRALAICILYLLAASGHVNAQTSARTKAAKIDEVMIAASNLRQFNGSVLVTENGNVIYKKGLGLANMEWNIPNTPDTKFRLGSITKQFTAALILQLVQEGKIKLDGKLSDYLPAYRKDTGERITIHQLLNHTSGIPSYTGLARFMEEAARNPYGVDDFVKKFASNDLEFEPGTKFAYNNSGYFLLGAIIEKVTGQSYEQALKTKILDPLGMKNTGYDHYGTILEKRASGYVKLPQGYKHAGYLDMSIPYAAGSMYSTVEDLYLWDQALYTDRVLSPEFKALMFKPNLSEYAYGWAITETKLGSSDEKLLRIAHDGGIPGFNTSIVRIPAQKHLIVFLDNTSQGGSLRRLERAITNILYGQPYDVPKISIAEVMLKTINDKGVEAGIAQYREYKERQPTRYDFSEGEINQLGYQLLRTGKLKDAIEIFKLNVEIFPQSANTYDSLGEGFLNSGNTEFAIQNYKRSLALDPKNENAVTMLKRLESKPVSIAPHLLDVYVGEYEVTPDFKVKVFKDGEKLMTQATGQQPFELSPDGENAFFIKAVNARVTFGKDDKGAVTGLVIHQNGQEVPGRKIK